MNSFNKWQPFIYGLLIALGIMVGMWLKPATNNTVGLFGGGGRLDEILHVINETYVDSVKTNDLEVNAIEKVLTQLDPHSVFIPAEDLSRTNEQLEGEFEGIGIEFNIHNDTIMVVSALNGGPSKELGIRSGDRIIEVDGKKIASTGITNEEVFKLLRGKKGTKVSVTILRYAPKEKKVYNITRGKIPIYSVDAHMMLNENTGYIKISRFSATTYKEFTDAIKELQLQHMQHLVVDLRGNPGGYLNAVTEMADEVLNDKKLIVYTQGLHQPRTEYKAEKNGLFEQGKLIVLVDEGSASASEIFSGAVQDHDRGIIIGRRTFGKGLVQEPFELSDGSALRITVARYYTPSGRCIQKPYEDIQAYEHEILNRYEKGEMKDSSAYKNQDTTVYFTAGKRKVYGGGGIKPDIFIPIDTSWQNEFMSDIFSQGIINDFILTYTDNNRETLSKFKTAEDFNTHFNQALLNPFLNYASNKGYKPTASELKSSSIYLSTHLKALTARQLFRDEGYFKVINMSDRYIAKAIECLKNYDSILSAGKLK